MKLQNEVVLVSGANRGLGRALVQIALETGARRIYAGVTQALRCELAPKHIAVHGVLAGAMDTDMVRAMEMPKTPPLEVARNIVRAVERGEEDILPESTSRGMFEVWRRAPRELERAMAAGSTPR